MKRAAMLLGTLLAVTSAPAAAEWVLMGSSDEANIYYDPASMVHKPDRITVWILDDYHVEQENGANSRVLLYEIRCADREASSMQFVAYADAMGKGDVVGSRQWDVPRFRQFAPGSVGSEMVLTVCPR